jgi:hypothetical protein
MIKRIGGRRPTQLSRITRKRAQQEMVGFILIVVLVMVGIFVFIAISLRQPTEGVESSEAKEVLDVLMDYTTGCAEVGVNYLDVRDLVKSCAKNKQCSNLGERSCDYLNSSLSTLIEQVMRNENSISGIEVEQEERILFDYSQGNCSGTVFEGSLDAIYNPSGDIYSKLIFCY